MESPPGRFPLRCIPGAFESIGGGAFGVTLKKDVGLQLADMDFARHTLGV